MLDGVGAGAAVDADRFGDAGADTLGHVAAAAGGLRVPNLERLGLGLVAPLAGVAEVARPAALVGRLAERSPAKDSTTGHWELMGCRTDVAPPTYPEGFPSEVMEALTAATGLRWLCNAPASGTEVIERFGVEHLRTGRPIVYTSADSVFQLAAHQDVMDAEALYAACRAARAVLAGPHAVSRVIARPFAGRPGAFRRTAGRRDLALPPPRPTALDALAEAGVPVHGIGKVAQLFAGRAIAQDHPAAGNHEAMGIVGDLLQGLDAGLFLANLIDFDTLHGHRNDPAGFAACLEDLDRDLGDLLPALRPDDLLILTADHGNDPTLPSTDHTREWVPLLVDVPGRDPGEARWVGELGDVGQTVLAALAPAAPRTGLSGRPIPLPGG